MKPADSAEFKGSGDFQSQLMGVKGFFRTLQRTREYDAAETQRTKQETRRKSKTVRNKGGYFPYLKQKEGQRQQDSSVSSSS